MAATVVPVKGSSEVMWRVVWRRNPLHFRYRQSNLPRVRD